MAHDHDEIGLAQDVLVIEPNHEAVRKRPKVLVNMDKQIGRADLEKVDITKDEYFIHAGTEEEKMDHPGRKGVVSYNFGAAKPRFEDHKAMLNGDLNDLLHKDELVLEPAHLPKKVKGHISKAPRFPEPA